MNTSATAVHLWPGASMVMDGDENGDKGVVQTPITEKESISRVTTSKKVDSLVTVPVFVQRNEAVERHSLLPTFRDMTVALEKNSITPLFEEWCRNMVNETQAMVNETQATVTRKRKELTGLDEKLRTTEAALRVTESALCKINIELQKTTAEVKVVTDGMSCAQKRKATEEREIAKLDQEKHKSLALLEAASSYTFEQLKRAQKLRKSNQGLEQPIIFHSQ